MYAKVTTVRLVAKDTGRTEAFDVNHATRLLRWKDSGWELDDDKFVFEENEIKRKTNKGRGSKSEQKEGDN